MLFKYIKKYYSIDKTERKILNRTFFWLLYALILVRIIPLRWFSHFLGDFNKEGVCNCNENELQLIEIEIKNIKRLKKRIPWKIKCFEEAITAKKVLGSYNVITTIYLGVAKNNKKLIAHAWLKYGEVFITGKKGYDQFVVVGFYT